MQFTYQARDGGGRIRDGQISAPSADEAALLLRQDGLYLLSLQEAAAAATAGFTLFQKKASRSEVICALSQLAVMVDAGVALASALDGLGRQAENAALKGMLQEIGRQVEAGDNLSAALARFPRHFDGTCVNLIKASEASGTLAPMLDRIATQAQAELETRQKVVGALLYPAAMLVMCVGVSVFLLTYVFPKLTPMFGARSLDLPGPTKFMMALSGALTDYWYLFLLALAAAVAGVVWARRRPWGRQALDWLWINFPVVGPMLRKVALGRSIRTLATTINAGVPILQALELSGGVANNVHYERCWREVAEQVTSGRQIHEALEGNGLFPDTLQQMIASGEATGKLGQVLNKVSDHFDREVANAVRAATSLVEPIMVAVMGGVIGTIALAMLLPIFTLSNHGG